MKRRTRRIQPSHWDSRLLVLVGLLLPHLLLDLGLRQDLDRVLAVDVARAAPDRGGGHDVSWVGGIVLEIRDKDGGVLRKTSGCVCLPVRQKDRDRVQV